MVHLENEFCILLETKEGKILRVDKILLTVNEISKEDFNTLRNVKQLIINLKHSKAWYEV